MCYVEYSVMYKRIAKEKECGRQCGIYMPRAKRTKLSEVKTLRVTDDTVTSLFIDS